MRIRLAVVAAILSLGAVQVALADTVTMTNIQTDLSDFTTVSLSYGAWAGNENAGAIKWHVDSTTPNNLALSGTQLSGKNLITFCIEIGQNVYINSSGNVWNVTSLLNAPMGPGAVPTDPATMSNAQASLIYGLYLNESVDPLHKSIFSTAAIDSATRGEAAAFQLAVWEIVYGNGTFSLTSSSGVDTLSSGSFAASSPKGVVDRANTLLSNVLVLDPAFYDYQGNGGTATGMVALTSNGIQDQALAFLPTGGDAQSPAPLPSVAGMGGAMLSVLALGKLRLTKRPA